MRSLLRPSRAASWIAYFDSLGVVIVVVLNVWGIDGELWWGKCSRQRVII
jgi:hypothetical protein